jgi:hypothetical protein
MPSFRTGEKIARVARVTNMDKTSRVDKTTSTASKTRVANTTRVTRAISTARITSMVKTIRDANKTTAGRMIDMTEVVQNEPTAAMTTGMKGEVDMIALTGLTGEDVTVTTAGTMITGTKKEDTFNRV